MNIYIVSFLLALVDTYFCQKYFKNYLYNMFKIRSFLLIFLTSYGLIFTILKYVLFQE